MAEQDEDWKAFLAATELDDDDVETPDGEDENLEDDELGDDKKKTEKPDEGSEEGDDADNEEEGDDLDKAKKPKPADPKKPEEEAEAYKPRLTQFLNDKGELDAKKIEDSYIASSKEGVRLNARVEELEGNLKEVLQAISKNPEAAKKILGEKGATDLAADVAGKTAPKDPILADYEAKLTKTSMAEYDTFIEQHPEAVSDPVKAKKISSFLKFYGPWYQTENNGEIAGMKDSLEAAYRQYGWDLEIKKTEGAASAAKKAAAQKTVQQSKKPAKKGSFTKEELHFARKLGVTL